MHETTETILMLMDRATKIHDHDTLVDFTVQVKLLLPDALKRIQELEAAVGQACGLFHRKEGFYRDRLADQCRQIDDLLDLAGRR